MMSSYPTSQHPSHLPAGLRDPAEVDRRVLGITRPDRVLWTYYVIVACVIPPAAIVLLPLLYARYRTMHYTFREEGVSMRWGLLFRREVIVNYARIQDISLKSNFLERWLGLACIRLQTASAGAEAELTIEGLREFELVREFLHRRTGRSRARVDAGRAGAPVAAGAVASAPAVATMLRQVCAELRATRVVLAGSNAKEDGRLT